MSWFRSLLDAVTGVHAHAGLPDHAPAGSQPRSSQWSTVRAAHLAEYPTCAACGCRRNLAVHHIVPFHLRPDLELVGANLCTLCESDTHNDHLIFGHALDFRLWNPFVVVDAARILGRIREARAEV